MDDHPKRMSPLSADTLEKNLALTYGDQKRQVEFLINTVFDYQNCGLPRNGFFVDLACADGITINNTFFLERYLGWRGVLFEPNPGFQSSILKHRTSPLVTRCVADQENQTVRFRIDNGMLGGIISEHTDNNLTARGEELKNADIVEMETTTLVSELDRMNAPTQIDFLSLDVEGAEYLILKNFDFKRYVFRCLAIERPEPALDLLLDQHGYRQVAHLSYDVIYVHKNYISKVNFHPDIKFMFTPRKDW